jgi:hypothetical protein
VEEEEIKSEEEEEEDEKDEVDNKRDALLCLLINEDTELEE